MIIEYALLAMKDIPAFLYSAVIDYKFTAALVFFGLLFIIVFVIKKV